MPSINLLLIPLIGAYFLITTTYFFKHRQKLLDRQRLIFFTILWSFFLLILAFLISTVIKKFFPDVSYLILSHIPIKEKWIGTSLLSFLLGLFLPLLINPFCGEARSFELAVRRYGDVFQNLLLNSLTRKDLLMVSLKSTKVYIGFVDSIPGDPKYFNITPVINGFRNEEQEIVLTTNYAAAYREFNKEVEQSAEPESFDHFGGSIEKIEITIPTDELISASKFDPYLYDQMNDDNKDDDGQKI